MSYNDGKEKALTKMTFSFSVLSYAFKIYSKQQRTEEQKEKAATRCFCVVASAQPQEGPPTHAFGISIFTTAGIQHTTSYAFYTSFDICLAVDFGADGAYPTRDGDKAFDDYARRVCLHFRPWCLFVPPPLIDILRPLSCC